MYSNNPSSPDELGNSQSHSNLGSYHSHHLKKKRVGKACDSCRIKKTKCDGKKPCNKCIQDNKICVFTEKKKLKEKNYPSGYVELLETRLDLLTKSFEKVLQLSRPHLKFLQDLSEKSSPQASNSVSNESSNTTTPASDEIADEPVIPINKVINYLITNQGLLNNLPLEWEGGAFIAANFNEAEFETASRKFASHKMSLGNSHIESSSHSNESPSGQPSNVVHNNPNVSTHDVNDASPAQEPRQVDVSPIDSIQIKQEPDDFDDNDEFKFTLADQINLNDFSLGGYSSGGFVLANSALLNDGVNSNDLSDFDSDSNSIYSNKQPQHQVYPPTLPTQHTPNAGPISPKIDASSFRPPSLFSTHESPNNDMFLNRNSSVSSLTNKFEKQAIVSPTTISPSATYDTNNPQSGQHPTLVRRSSSVLSRSYSYSKIKASGHVHKPTHNSSHSRSGSSIGTTGSEFLLQKPAKTKSINIEADNAFTLPSDTVQMSDLNLMDDDDILNRQFDL